MSDSVEGPGRQPREFLVYRGPRCVLHAEATPGTLRSTAPLPPPDSGFTPPEHPFINAQAIDAMSESQLGRILSESSSFDDFLARLIGEGFDIASSAPSLPMTYEHRAALRVVAADGSVVGALWDGPGQFTTLDWQPAGDALIVGFATLTAYRDDLAAQFRDALSASATFHDLVAALRARGLRLVETTAD